MSNSEKIVQKIILNVPVKAMSPLRIASGTDDGLVDILILKNKQGNPFVPGTSLAGVLRNEIASIYGDEVAGKIFGSTDDDGNQSMINIGDVILSDAMLIHRDGVSIDTFSGVGINGAKYDYEAIERGATGILQIEITVRKVLLDTVNMVPKHSKLAKPNEKFIDVAASIADLLTKGIDVGSLTTKGYGKLASVKPVEVYVFNFVETSVAEAWLKYLDNGTVSKPIYIGNGEYVQRRKANDFEMEVDFALQSSMIVRDVEEAQMRTENLSSVQLRSGNDYVIPGTSIKGLLRNRAKKILTVLNNGDVKKADSFIDDLMGYADRNHAKKSRLTVDEIYISKDMLKNIKHSRNRINRFTGGTIDSALFTEEPVWQQRKDTAPIRMKVRVNDCTKKEAGLILLVLKDLWLGKLPIGGGKSIGRGVLLGKGCTITFAGEIIKINSNGVPDTTAHKNFLEDCVRRLVVENNG